MMQITEPPQRATPQAEMLQVLSGKAILLLTSPMPDQILKTLPFPRALSFHPLPPLVQLPTSQQGCPVSQTKELTLISTAIPQKFPQTLALSLSFLCSQHEAELNALRAIQLSSVVALSLCQTLFHQVIQYYAD